MGQLILPHERERIEEVDSIEMQHLPRGVKTAMMSGVDRVVKPAPIGASCKRTYTAQRQSGIRPLTEIWWMVMHDEEALTALAAASWFGNSDSQGSAHLCIDDVECYRTLGDERIPWGAPGANYHGLHFEEAGYANWTRKTWTIEHHLTIDRAAYKVAFHIAKYRDNKIKVDFIDHVGLQRGKRGVTTHAECTKAFGGSHTDPGKGWPVDVFMMRVEHFYAAMTDKRVRPKS